jgi:hypothetical protein
MLTLIFALWITAHPFPWHPPVHTIKPPVIHGGPTRWP